MKFVEEKRERENKEEGEKSSRVAEEWRGIENEGEMFAF